MASGQTGNQFAKVSVQVRTAVPGRARRWVFPTQNAVTWMSSSSGSRIPEQAWIKHHTQTQKIKSSFDVFRSQMGRMCMVDVSSLDSPECVCVCGPPAFQHNGDYSNDSIHYHCLIQITAHADTHPPFWNATIRGCQVLSASRHHLDMFSVNLLGAVNLWKSCSLTQKCFLIQ